MRHLRDQVGESVHLYVRERDTRTCIAAVEARHELRPFIQLGRPLPLRAGAAGKLLLAFADEDIQRLELRRPRQERRGQLPHMPRGGTQRPARADPPERWATSVGERENGVAAAATPVVDSRERVVAALCVSRSDDPPEPRAPRRDAQAARGRRRPRSAGCCAAADRAHRGNLGLRRPAAVGDDVQPPRPTNNRAMPAAAAAVSVSPTQEHRADHADRRDGHEQHARRDGRQASPQGQDAPHPEPAGKHTWYRTSGPPARSRRSRAGRQRQARRARSQPPPSGAAMASAPGVSRSSGGRERGRWRRPALRQPRSASRTPQRRPARRHQPPRLHETAGCRRRPAAAP